MSERATPVIHLARKPRSRRAGHADPIVEAMFAQAAASAELARATADQAAAIREATATLKPAADGLHGLFEAQQKLCSFLVGNRLKIFGSIPVVLVAIGAISPNAAGMLASVLKALGVTP